jgi:hypothetical protein
MKKYLVLPLIGVLAIVATSASAANRKATVRLAPKHTLATARTALAMRAPGSAAMVRSVATQSAARQQHAFVTTRPGMTAHSAIASRSARARMTVKLGAHMRPAARMVPAK